MEDLELDKVEEIATQMDGEVPSMSGSHGNLLDRSHHGICGKELRVVVTAGLAHCTSHFTPKHFVFKQRGVGDKYITSASPCKRKSYEIHRKCK